MSVEDEVELKDLLLQTLTENGSLAKIRAQLRASVFLALEEDSELNTKRPLLNEKVKTCLNTSEGQLMFCIVKEFLEFLNLQSTMAVFDSESYLGQIYHYNGRSKISKDLGLSNDETVPLLQQLVHIAQEKTKRLEVNLNISEENLGSLDNNISNSENSIKTESELNGELSDSNTYSSSLSSTKENGKHNIDEESLNNINSTYENGNNTADMNSTFITEPSIPQNSTEEFTNSKGNLTYDITSPVIENVSNSTQHITFISEKTDEVTTPVLKDLKNSPERVKSPPKGDKFKSKNSLNSLADLPPLNMNKKGPGTILPSLYSKEFREKPNS